MKLLAVFLILFAVEARAQDTALTVLNAGLTGVDIAQTSNCLGAGTCKELNPLFTNASPEAIGIIKGAATAGILVAIHKYTKPKSKRRYASLILYATIQGIVIAHNHSVLQK